MPEITGIHIVLLLGTACLGAWLGWLWRSRRATLEKSVVNAQWQDQLESQRRQQQHLVEQNKTLMEQNSHYRASTKDASSRAAELSDALNEASERRDRLQRQIEDVRTDLEAVVTERDRLQSDRDELAVSADSPALRERDARIAKLTRDLESWQARLPPLIERFRARDAEAGRLETELAAANERIRSLESTLTANESRAAPAGRASRDDALDAASGSNAAPAAAERSNGGDARDVRDDLKMIKGVGPAIEKTLNEMGVFRFDQIAAMTELEIDRIANRLKGFRSRIYREDWMGQARDLQLQAAADQ
jgi:predicted flap endonuclease-1-like 5' DNA nuclease/regulator of replication initiation timing